MDNRQNTVQIASSQINAISNYENITPSEIAREKQLELHDIMYKKAVASMKAEYNSIFKNSEYVITELGNGSICDAPFVSISVWKNENTSTSPKRYLFSLEKWWPAALNTDNATSDNAYITIINNKTSKKPKFGYVTDWTNSECVYIDYVNNKAEITNKIYGWKRKIDLNLFFSINKEEILIPMSESMKKSVSGDMFSYQYKNGVVL